MNTCGRCGDEYESYHVLIRDDISDIRGYVSDDYDGLCKPCRMYVTEYGAYLTESERERLEPKRFVYEGENVKVEI
jgi:hypothetical protein